VRPARRSSLPAPDEFDARDPRPALGGRRSPYSVWTAFGATDEKEPKAKIAGPAPPKIK